MKIRKEPKRKEEFKRDFDVISRDYLHEAYDFTTFDKHKAYFLKKDMATPPSDYVKIAAYDEAVLPLK